MKKLLLILFISILYGCSKDFEPPHDNLENAQIANTKSVSDFQESKFGSPMVLGEKVQNPYSLKSLRETSRKARSATGDSAQATNIVATHHYVRFLPKDNHEYTLLLKNVRFFPFPLDRKIVEGGSFYRDPDPANEGKPFSWQYAVVPVQQALPDVQYEILDELCMPDESGQVLGKVGARGPVGPEGPTVLRVVVRVWDIALKQYIPLQGLAVNVINTALGQSLAYGITDATGTAVISGYFKVTKDIYYNIFWSDGEESKWFMTDVNNNQLFYNVKALAGVTNIDIKSSPSNVVVEQQLGTIHRAAYRTYYKTNSNLLRPNHEDAIGIAYQEEYSDRYAGLYRSQEPYSFLTSIIIVGRNSVGSLLSTKSIFSTTVHEFGHLNHDVNTGRSNAMIWSSERIIVESWARAIEKLLTDLEYSSYGYALFRTESLPDVGAPPGPIDNPYYMKDFVVPNDLNCQRWPFIDSYDLTTPRSQLMLAYSPLFIDLIDNENQQHYYNGRAIKDNWQSSYDYMYKEYPNDNVKNFTIGELQNLLKTTKTLEGFRSKVKLLSNLHENTTTAIDMLFIKYIEYWRKYNSAQGAPGCTPQGSGGCVIYD